MCGVAVPPTTIWWGVAHHLTQQDSTSCQGERQETSEESAKLPREHLINTTRGVLGESGADLPEHDALRHFLLLLSVSPPSGRFFFLGMHKTSQKITSRRPFASKLGLLCLAWSGGCIEGVLEGVWERHDVVRIFLRFDFSDFLVKNGRKRQEAPLKSVHAFSIDFAQM